MKLMMHVTSGELAALMATAETPSDLLHEPGLVALRMSLHLERLYAPRSSILDQTVVDKTAIPTDWEFGLCSEHRLGICEHDLIVCAILDAYEVTLWVSRTPSGMRYLKRPFAVGNPSQEPL